MRDQYAGDVSDLFKLAFLRALAGHERKLGVAWYYVPEHDGRPDGRHTEHRLETRWRSLDADLHRELAALQERSVESLERLPVWPAGTLFHRAPVAVRDRSAWVDGMARTLAEADLVFLDPDNGIGSDPKKHARLTDIAALRRDGRCVTVIKFPQFNLNHGVQLENLHRALGSVGFKKGATLVTSVSVPTAPGSASVVPRARFLALAGEDETLLLRLGKFHERLAAMGVRSRVVPWSRSGIASSTD